MGLIKEPKGVDFIIESKPLTREELELLSKFIRERKMSLKDKKQIKKTGAVKKKTPASATA